MNSQENNVSGRTQPQLGAGGIRFGPALAAIIYLLLVASAVIALGTRRFPGLFPPVLELIGPSLFLLFLICFAVYRLALVRARKYPTSKAFFQIGAAALFFTLLLPAAKSRYEPPLDDVEMLLTDDNPKVRALAAEVIGYRADGSKHASQLVKALRDPDLQVRKQAHRSLVRLSGEDLGSGQNEAELKAWESRFP